ncbi:MAG: VWA domain-containing protein [Candidatus Melainabacteria bacterium]|nr:VWA domain-containing protein [Candidatus Melainabacteria bacterium]
MTTNKKSNHLALSVLLLMQSCVLPVMADDSIPVAPTRLRRNLTPASAESTTKVLNGMVSQSRVGEAAPAQTTEQSGGLISNDNMSVFNSSPAPVQVPVQSAPLVQTQQFASPTKITQQAQVSQSSAPVQKHGFFAQDARKALEVGLGVATFFGGAVTRSAIPRMSGIPGSSFRAGTGTTYTPPPTSLAGSAFGGRQLTRQELAVLGSYDIAIVIDKSGSMSTNDCPGGMSRWDWCRDQMLGFARQTSSVFRQGIDILLFSSEFQAFPNTNFNAIKTVFANNRPSGGTQMSEPLEAVFNEHFRKRDQLGNTKKLIVEVISDGEPSDKGQVAVAIARATQRMQRPDEIIVSFLQIGNERDGASALTYFDNNLMRDGAMQDIVDVEPFYIVANQGLSQAILNAAQRRR